LSKPTMEYTADADWLHIQNCILLRMHTQIFLWRWLKMLHSAPLWPYLHCDGKF